MSRSGRSLLLSVDTSSGFEVIEAFDWSPVIFGALKPRTFGFTANSLRLASNGVFIALVEFRAIKPLLCMHGRIFTTRISAPVREML